MEKFMILLVYKNCCFPPYRAGGFLPKVFLDFYLVIYQPVTASGIVVLVRPCKRGRDRRVVDGYRHGRRVLFWLP